MGQGEGDRTPWRADPVTRQLWQRGAGVSLVLSQARHAQTVILALLGARGIERPVVAVPAFYGEHMLAPLRAAEADVRFYAMTSALQPDWQALERDVAVAGPPDVLMLVHYYGTEADGVTARTVADRHGALLFEDAAHTMLPAGEIGRHGHLTCYSPRKFYGTGDGAVLVVSGDALATEIEGVAPDIRSEPHRGGNGQLKLWWDRAAPWRRRSGSLPARDFDKVWDRPPDASPAVWMHPASRRRIEQLGLAGAEAIRQREIADTELIERHITAATPLRALPRRPEIAPYLLGLRGRSRPETEATYRRLREAGANVGTWPDLPLVVREQPERYGAALELRNTIIRVIPRFNDRREGTGFIRRLPVASG